MDAPKNKYTGTRLGFKIDRICIHHAAATKISVLDTTILKTARQVSAHYGVGETEIHQYVDEGDIAWHATHWDCNKHSIGIETVNSTGRVNGRDNDVNSWKISDVTLNTLIKLVADIAKRNNLGDLVPGKNLVWHSMYHNTYCPGNYLIGKMKYIADEANKLNKPVIVEPVAIKYVTYKVKPGDSLSTIAKVYKSTWQTIYQDNKKKIDDNAKAHGIKSKYYNFLSAGMELKVRK